MSKASKPISRSKGPVLETQAERAEGSRVVAVHTTNIFLWLSAIRQGRGAKNGKSQVYCRHGYKRCSEWSGSSTVRHTHAWDEARGRFSR